MIAYLTVNIKGNNIPLFNKVKTEYFSTSVLLSAMADLMDESIAKMNKYLQTPQYAIEHFTINECQISNDKMGDSDLGNNPHYVITVIIKAFNGESQLHINAANAILNHVGLILEDEWNDAGMNNIIDTVTKTKLSQVAILGSVETFRGVIVRWLCNMKINEGSVLRGLNV